MSDQLSRRDFLKVAGVGAFGLAFRKPIDKLDAVRVEVEQENTFETEKAKYIPFFENHLHTNSDQRILNAQPDCLFIEYASQTDGVLKDDPENILISESYIPGSTTFINEPPIYTGRFLSHELLEGLDELDSRVSVEGVVIFRRNL